MYFGCLGFVFCVLFHVSLGHCVLVLLVFVVLGLVSSVLRHVIGGRVGRKTLTQSICCSVKSWTEAGPSYESGTASNVAWQPRQQAPPSDDFDMIFPSPPPELSCPVADAAAVSWPTVSIDSVSFAVNSETVQPDYSVSQNFSKTSEPLVESTDSDNIVTETNDDNTSSAETYGDENMNSTLALIRRGVKLRKTITNDRSAPKLN